MKERQLTALLRLGRTATARRRSGCPDAATLAGYAAGAGGSRARIEAHLADCRYCLGQVGLLVRLGRGAEVPERPPDGLLAAARRLVPADSANGPVEWRRGLGALAASLLLALGLAIGMRGGPGEPPPAVRATAAAARLEVLEPPEGALLPAAGTRLRWTEVPGGFSYLVRLSDAGGNLLWEARLDATTTTLPAELGLTADELYFVWVRAELENGRSLRSPAVGFRVEGPP